MSPERPYNIPLRLSHANDENSPNSFTSLDGTIEVKIGIRSNKDMPRNWINVTCKISTCKLHSFPDHSQQGHEYRINALSQHSHLVSGFAFLLIVSCGDGATELQYIARGVVDVPETVGA